MVYTDDMEFEWDEGNQDKNFEKHGVSGEEAESVFWDSHKVQRPDPFHSLNEKRFVLIGNSKLQRLLFIVYTIRKDKIRIISARCLNKKEKYLYEKIA